MCAHGFIIDFSSCVLLFPFITLDFFFEKMPFPVFATEKKICVKRSKGGREKTLNISTAFLKDLGRASNHILVFVSFIILSEKLLSLSPKESAIKSAALSQKHDFLSRSSSPSCNVFLFPLALFFFFFQSRCAEACFIREYRVGMVTNRCVYVNG